MPSTLLEWGALAAQLTKSDVPTIGLRNGHPFLKFEDASVLSGYFNGVMPQGFAGEDLIVKIYYMMPTVTAGTVVFEASFERHNTDLDADSFDTAKTASSTVPGTAGIIGTATITFDNADEYDNIAVQEQFRLRVRVLNTDSGHTVSEDVQVTSVILLQSATLFGANAFTELSDAPSSFTGHGGEAVKVKADETGLEFGAVAGGGSSTVFLVFTPLNAIFPGSGFASFTVRNNHSLLAFDDSTVESIIFEGVMPSTYAGSTITVAIYWIAESAIADDVEWEVAFETLNASDVDSDNFDTGKTVVATANGTSGIYTKSEIAFTTAEADDMAAGHAFRIKVRRNGISGNDTMSGDAQLLRLSMRAS